MPSCPSDDTFTDFIEGRLTGHALNTFYSHASTCQTCAAALAELSRSTAPGPIPARVSTQIEGFARTASGPQDDWVVRPEVIGRYRPIDVLGAGGMGVVYLARDTQLNRDVALKITRTSISHAGARRMLREAQAMAKLSHRNVVAVHDVGMWQDRVFVAMEYLPGGTLARYLLEHPEPWDQVLAKFVKAGEGLAAAHRASIVHRDFKPENVLLSTDGEVRVADFGLARLASEDTLDTTGALNNHTQGELPDVLRIGLTRMGTLLGTPAYMAPEQTRGAAVDQRADMWSFCAALYEALYCELPFPGRTPREVLKHIELGSVRRVPLGSEVPLWLRKVLLKGLRADPAARYASMDALLNALCSPPLRAARWKRSARHGAMAAAFATLLVVGYEVVARQRTRDAQLQEHAALGNPVSRASASPTFHAPASADPRTEPVKAVASASPTSNSNGEVKTAPSADVASASNLRLHPNRSHARKATRTSNEEIAIANASQAEKAPEPAAAPEQQRPTEFEQPILRAVAGRGAPIIRD